jgi:hypothetical protein
MIGLIIALCVVVYMNVNTWLTIALMVGKGGMWVRRKDIPFLLVCTVFNPYLVYGIDKICGKINERFYKWNSKRKWNKRIKEYEKNKKNL